MTTNKQELQRLCDVFIEKHRFPRDGNTNPGHQSFVLREVDVRDFHALLLAELALKAQVPEGMLRVELALSDRSISRLIHVAQIETSNTNEVERYANQCWRELSAAKEGDAR